MDHYLSCQQIHKNGALGWRQNLSKYARDLMFDHVDEYHQYENRAKAICWQIIICFPTKITQNVHDLIDSCPGPPVRPERLFQVGPVSV